MLFIPTSGHTDEHPQFSLFKLTNDSDFFVNFGLIFQTNFAATQKKFWSCPSEIQCFTLFNPSFY